MVKLVLRLNPNKQQMKTFTTTNGIKCIVLNYGKKPIYATNISYIEGEGNYSTIQCINEKKIFSSFTLKMFSQHLLEDFNFFCPRKGLLINLDELKGIIIKDGCKFIQMNDGTKHAISRRKGRDLIEFISAAKKWEVEVRNIA